MPLGVVIVEGAEYSGSLITARLAMEFGREVFGVPGNVTQPVSYAPNQLIKQGAKLVPNAEDIIEELPTPVRAALVKAEQPLTEQRNLLAAQDLTPQKRRFSFCSPSTIPRPSTTSSSAPACTLRRFLATLFNLEMKSIVRQWPGKQFSKVLL